MFLPSSSDDPSEAPDDERDLDWEDYNYEWDLAEGGGSNAENRLYWPGSLTSKRWMFKEMERWFSSNFEEMEVLLRNLPIQDAANQAPGMTMAKAVEVNYKGVQCMNET